LARKCDFLGNFPTKDGVAQLVVEDEDGPGELVGGDERFERNGRGPARGRRILNPERSRAVMWL
jgi:hypothetical protein